MNKVLRFMLLSFSFILSFYILGKYEQSFAQVSDTVKIRVLSTGTHTKGEESFISAKNGYEVGDNSADDNVVTSNDYVKYQVDLNIAAGPKRTLYLKFENSGQSLDFEGLENLKMDSVFVNNDYNNYGKTWSYKIPRGVSLRLTGQFSLKAKDTHGNVENDNSIKATLTSSESDFEPFISTAKNITVVSKNLYDLGIDTDIDVNRTYTQSDDYGYFKIEDIPIKVEGYGRQGITSKGAWITDLDVSSFPSDTKWWVDNEQQDVSNGILRNIIGSTYGVKIKYKLPDKDKPTTTNTFKTYTVKLLPHKDANNIKDLGSSEGPTFSTAKSTYKGNTIYSLEGHAFRNNNYAEGIWQYSPKPTGNVLNLSLMLPRNYNKTIFEEENIHFNTKTPYYLQGEDGIDSFYKTITKDNEFYIKTSIKAHRITDNQDDLIVGATIIKDTTSVKANFDTDKNVVVLFDSKVVDPSQYSVYWRHNESEYLGDNGINWVESSKPLGGDYNQYKVVFKNNEYSKHEDMKICVPMKALDNYTKEDIQGKRIYISATVKNKRTYKDDSGAEYYREGLTVSLPQKPEMISQLISYRPDFSKYTKKFSVNFETYDKILNAYTTKGYKIIRKFTIPEVYDISTFKYDDKDYKMSVKGREITLTKETDPITKTFTSTTEVYALHMSLDTRTNLRGLNINGDIKEEVRLEYPSFASIPKGEIVNNTITPYRFEGNEEFGTQLTSVKKTDDNIAEFNYKIVLGGSVKKDIAITLPYLGDEENLKEVNRYNNTNVTLDEKGADTTDTMDGYGKSIFNGKYKIKNITISDLEFKNNYNIIENNNPISTQAFNKQDNGVVFNGNENKYGDNRIVLKLNKDNYSFIKNPVDSVTNKIINIKVKLEFDNLKRGQHVVSYISKLDNNDRISWPDYVEAIKSSIRGNVINDKNNNRKFDEKDEGISNIEVSLYKDNKKLKSTNTNENGEYLFDELTHGDYEVRLDKVKRNAGVDNYINSSEENLVSEKTNRFGIKEKTIQTIGNGYYKYVDTKYKVNLVINEQAKDKNFGFFTPESDLALDVESGETSDNTNYTDVSYDINIKNKGNTTLKDLKLTDIISNELNNVSYNMDYNTLDYPFKNQEILKTIGKNPTNDSADGGTAIATNKGYYIIDSYNKKPVIKEVKGLKGKIKAITGYYPAGRGGSAVATDKGYYIIDSYAQFQPKAIKVNGIKGDIMLIAGNRPISEYYNRESTDYGSVVATNKGVFIISYDRARTKIMNVDYEDYDIEGQPKYILAEDLQGNTGIGLATSEGYYIMDKSNHNKIKIIKADDPFGDIHIEGPIQKIIGSDPSEYMSAVVTGADYYVLTTNIYSDNSEDDFRPHMLKTNDENFINIMDGKGTFIGTDPESGVLAISKNGKIYFLKANEYEYTLTANYIENETFYRSIKYALGMFPESSGAAIVTEDNKCYIMTYKNSQLKISEIKKIKGSIQKIIGIFPTSGIGVYTNEGYYLVNYNDGDPIVTKVEGIEGNIKDIVGTEPLEEASGSLVITNKNVYTVEYNNGNPIVREADLPEITLTGEELSPASTNIGKTTTSRDFNLPELAPGDKITIHVSGKSTKKHDPYLIGHQAYITSPQTPRSGITTSKVTGTNKQPGVPDDFVLPSLENYFSRGMKGNPTIMLNSSIDSDGDYGSNSIATDPKNPKDDLADQVATEIEALPKEDKTTFGDIGGKAFLDLDHDNLYTSKDRLLPNIHVSIENENGEVIKDTYTDDQGQYSFKELPSSDKYRIHFDILGIKIDNKPTTTLDVSNLTDNDNDTDPSGYVEDYITPTDTPTIGKSDLGLKFIKAGVSIIKGQTKDDTHNIFGEYALTDDTLQLKNDNVDDISPLKANTDSSLDDGDNDPRTNYNKFTIVNSGQVSISNIKLTDTTVKGNNSTILEKAYYTENNKDYNPVSISKEKNSKEITIKAENKQPLVMAPGSKVIGAFGFTFDKKSPTHKNSLEVKASAIAHDTVVSSISDTDTFEANYIYKPNKNLHIDLYGVENVEDKNKERLNFIPLKIYKKEGDEYKLQGTYNTGLQGLDILLGEGEYKVVQQKGYLGYVLPPKDGWIIKLKYQGDNLTTTISASTKMPYSETVKGEDWGKVNLYNYRNASIPITGGNLLQLTIAGSIIAIIGLTVCIIRYKTRIKN